MRDAMDYMLTGSKAVMAIDQASDFAIEQLGLGVRNTVRGAESNEFFIPGSLIRLDLDTDDRLAYGMPEEGIAFFVRSQVFDAVERRDVDVFSRYARDDYLASGWALGADDLLTGGDAGVTQTGLRPEPHAGARGAPTPHAAPAGRALPRALAGVVPQPARARRRVGSRPGSSRLY